MSALPPEGPSFDPKQRIDVPRDSLFGKETLQTPGTKKQAQEKTRLDAAERAIEELGNENQKLRRAIETLYRRRPRLWDIDIEVDDQVFAILCALLGIALHVALDLTPLESSFLHEAGTLLFGGAIGLAGKGRMPGKKH